MEENTDLIISISTDQAALRRSIQRIEQSLSGLSGSVKKQFDAVGKSIDNSVATTMQNRINSMVGIGTKGAKEWTGALADQSKELDRLKAKYSPLFAAQNSYLTTIKEIKTAHSIGALSAKEMTTAIQQQKAAFASQVAVINDRNKALKGAPGSSGASNRKQVLGYQLFDIGQGLASGMPAQMIAAQQGPQIAQMYAGNGGFKAAIGDVTSIIGGIAGATGLIPLAFAAASAGAYAFYSTIKEKTKTTDEVLTQHAANIKALADAYGIAEEKATSYSRIDRAIAESSTRRSGADLAAKRVEEISNLAKQFGQIGGGGKGAAPVFQMKGGYAAFLSAFKDLQATGDVVQFAESIKRIGEEKGFQTQADRILEATKVLRDLNTEADKTARLLKEISSDKGPGGLLLSQGPTNTGDMGNYELFKKQQEGAARRSQQALDAQLLGVNARSPEERAAAARAAAAAQYNDEETVADRKRRIEQASILALAEANKSLADAQRDRAMGLDRMVDDQQLELQLLGKSVTEQDRLRKEYELIASLKEDAARNGTAVDEDEITRIKQKAAEYAKLGEEIGKARLTSDLAKDQRLRGLSSLDQRVSGTLDQYGLPNDLQSQQADQIRKALQQNDVADGIHSFLSEFESALVQNGGDIGDALGSAIKSAALNAMNKTLESLFSQLGNGIAQAIFGGSAAPAAGGATSAVSSIIGTAAVGAVTRAPLGDIGTYRKAIQMVESGGNYSALGPITASGDRAYGAMQVMGANIPSWTKTALGKSLTPSEFLANPAAQDTVFDHYFGKSVARYGNPQDAASVWFTGKPLSQGANAADVLGTTGSQYVDKFTANVDKLSGAATDASQNLTTFGGGLGKLGSSLASAFPAAPAGGGGGGLGSFFSSIFGGYNPVAMSSQAALLAPLAGTGVGLFAAGGHVNGPGSGSSDSIPAMLSNGEFVINAASTRKHRALLEAINGGTIGRFAAGGIVRSATVPVMPGISKSYAANDNSRQPGILQVHIVGAYGDEHVRALVKQGVGEGLHSYNEDQRRGGFGTLQGRFRSQKG